MPLQILELGRQFRPATSIVYPPFKSGQYMEEYFYDYALRCREEFHTDRIYIPVFWTNIQTHPGFHDNKKNYETLLSLAMKKYPPTTKFFTIVQHDDGPQLRMKYDVLVFGACSGSVPLPLIYEDNKNTLLNIPRPPRKSLLASLIAANTHPLRLKLNNTLKNHTDVFLALQGTWTSSVPQNRMQLFMEKTLDSKFSLAPRGYGRSSFRFFEAMLLDTVPVYFWDDVEWLPYKDVLDYSKFAVSIQEKDIEKTYEILASISDEQYQTMLDEVKRVRRWFTLEGMSDYIQGYLEREDE